MDRSTVNAGEGDEDSRPLEDRLRVERLEERDVKKTEALIAELPEKKPAAAPAMPHGDF